MGSISAIQFHAPVEKSHLLDKALSMPSFLVNTGAEVGIVGVQRSSWSSRKRINDH